LRFSESLKKNHEFRRLYAKGRSSASRFMVVYCRENRRGVNRVGFTVSSKLGGAVARNRMRRRLREVYRLNEPTLAPGFDIVVVARHSTAEAPFGELSRDFVRLCRAVGASARRSGAGTPRRAVVNGAGRAADKP
jgi:ribonuclease P protein component